MVLVDEEIVEDLETEGDSWSYGDTPDYNANEFNSHSQDGGVDYKAMFKKLLKENKKLKGKTMNLVKTKKLKNLENLKYLTVKITLCFNFIRRKWCCTK